MPTATTKAKFSFRIEEYPTVGRFVYDAFVQDKADFADYTDFNPPFEANFKAALDLVNATVNPVTLTNQLSLVTEQLYTTTFSLRLIIDKVDNYVNNAAANLNVQANKFGVKEVRAAITSLDVEGLDARLKDLLQAITNNTAALTAKGYKASITTDIQTIKQTIFDANAQQQALMKQRSKLATDNMSLLNDTYDNFINKTVTQAKNIYRNTNPNKLTAYTYAAILKSIRNEALKTLVEGVITDAAGKAVKGATVLFKPTDGTGGKKLTTKADGKYSVAGLKPNTYSVIVSAGALSKIATLTLASAQHTTLDITLS